MDRAEKRALEAFPIPSAIPEKEKENILKCGRRRIYANGYRRAEQDLALTWEDVKNLDHLLHDVDFENGRAEFLGNEIPFDGDEGFYGEVLKRFNIQRNK